MRKNTFPCCLSDRGVNNKRMEIAIHRSTPNQQSGTANRSLYRQYLSRVSIHSSNAYCVRVIISRIKHRNVETMWISLGRKKRFWGIGLDLRQDSHISARQRKQVGLERISSVPGVQKHNSGLRTKLITLRVW